jgi:hypothetical protein
MNHWVVIAVITTGIFGVIGIFLKNSFTTMRNFSKELGIVKERLGKTPVLASDHKVLEICELKRLHQQQEITKIENRITNLESKVMSSANAITNYAQMTLEHAEVMEKVMLDIIIERNKERENDRKNKR